MMRTSKLSHKLAAPVRRRASLDGDLNFNILRLHLSKEILRKRRFMPIYFFGSV